MACEDYPCCGHDFGDCPDFNGRFKCVECGRMLPRNAASSICSRCLDLMSKMMNDGDEFPTMTETERRYY